MRFTRLTIAAAVVSLVLASPNQSLRPLMTELKEGTRRMEHHLSRRDIYSPMDLNYVLGQRFQLCVCQLTAMSKRKRRLESKLGPVKKPSPDLIKVFEVRCKYLQRDMMSMMLATEDSRMDYENGRLLASCMCFQSPNIEWRDQEAIPLMKKCEPLVLANLVSETRYTERIASDPEEVRYARKRLDRMREKVGRMVSAAEHYDTSHWPLIKVADDNNQNPPKPGGDGKSDVKAETSLVPINQRISFPASKVGTDDKKGYERPASSGLLNAPQVWEPFAAGLSSVRDAAAKYLRPFGNGLPAIN